MILLIGSKMLLDAKPRKSVNHTELALGHLSEQVNRFPRIVYGGVCF